MKVKIKKLHEDAVIPEYVKPGDAGLDLTATSMNVVYHGDGSDVKIIYGTGLAVEIPEGYVGLIFPRSSVHKTSCRLSNSVGVIDSGYRGEIKFVFDRLLNKDLNVPYKIGDRIGQLIIMPYPKIELEEVEELSDTERGDGGFGSSGK